ncbi:MAG: hypothetical protein ABSF00_00940 [Candidatus Bathyarchaeia archaeon]
MPVESDNITAIRVSFQVAAIVNALVKAKKLHSADELLRQVLGVGA